MRDVIVEKLNEMNQFLLSKVNNEALDDSELIEYFSEKYNQLITKLEKENQTKDIDFKLNFLFHLMNESAFIIANDRVRNKGGWIIEAQNRLIIIFLKSFNEVRYLITVGFSSAALAVMRKMYEIGVILEIISKNDQSISEKYLKHSNVSRFKIANYLKLHDVKSKVKKELRDMDIDEFDDYSWANSLFENRQKTERITFKNLVDITSYKEKYSYYQLFNKSVHADIFDSLSGVDTLNIKNKAAYWNVEPSDSGKELAFKMFSEIFRMILVEYVREKDNYIGPFVYYSLLQISYTD